SPCSINIQNRRLLGRSSGKKKAITVRPSGKLDRLSCTWHQAHSARGGADSGGGVVYPRPSGFSWVSMTPARCSSSRRLISIERDIDGTPLAIAEKVSAPNIRLRTINGFHLSATR